MSVSKRMVVGSDHAGFGLKEALKAWLQNAGYQVEDVGCYSLEPCAYPGISASVVEAMRTHNIEQALICCGSGVGVAIGANRFPGIRAVVAHDLWIAEMSRRHNQANVICMGGRVLAPELAKDILETWLNTSFEGERHQARIDELDTISGPFGQSETGGKTACSI